MEGGGRGEGGGEARTVASNGWRREGGGAVEVIVSRGIDRGIDQLRRAKRAKRERERGGERLYFHPTEFFISDSFFFFSERSFENRKFRI